MGNSFLGSITVIVDEIVAIVIKGDFLGTAETIVEEDKAIKGVITIAFNKGVKLLLGVN